MILAISESSLIIFLALCAAQLLRRRSAAVRHFVLVAGLIGSVTVPFLSKVVPGFGFSPAPKLYAFVQDQAELFRNLNEEIPSPLFRTPVPPQRTNQVWLWLWGTGTAIGTILLVAGAAHMARVSFCSLPVTHSIWKPISEDVAGGLQLNRRVRLLQNRGCVLGTWGIFRPAVLIPHDAETWTAERIRTVLTHEFAHVKRLDWPVQMLAEIARAVYWFNPLFWLACRRLRIESELACDDVVLNAGIDAKDYAADLLELVRTLRNHKRVWSPILAMSRPPNLERRFVAMLNPALNHRLMSRGTAVAITILSICVTLPVSAMRAPQTIVETPPNTPPVAAAPPVQPVLVPTPVPKAAVSPPAVASAKPAPVARPVAVQGRADGNLRGTVSDSSGAMLPGVQVMVTRVDAQIAEEVVTNEAGVYFFPALPAGLYLLTAQLPGFANAARRVQIVTSQPASQNLILSVGGLTQRVEVSVAGTPRPQAVPSGPRRIRVGGNVQAANLISQVKPAYPVTARDSGIEGTVHLQGIIGIEGTLIGLRVISSNDAALAAAALESVSQWRYRPTMLNGAPVEVITEIDVDFKLVQ